MSTGGDFALVRAADPVTGAFYMERIMTDVSVEIVRPADVLAYLVGDSVNTSTTVPTAIPFTGLARAAAADGYLVKALLMTDQAACVAQMRLWLFSASPFLTIDNGPFLIKYADKAAAMGYVDFPALATEAGSDCAMAVVGLGSTPLRLPFQTGVGTGLFGVLETKTAFTPASGQKFFMTLTAEQE